MECWKTQAAEESKEERAKIPAAVTGDKDSLEWVYVEAIDLGCSRVFAHELTDDEGNVYRDNIRKLVEAKKNNLILTPHYELRHKERVKDTKRYTRMGQDDWVTFIKERIGGQNWLFSVDVRGERIVKVAIEYKLHKSMHRLVLGFHKGGMAVVTIIIIN